MELSQKDIFFLFFKQFLGTFDLALYSHVSITIWGPGGKLKFSKMLREKKWMVSLTQTI